MTEAILVEATEKFTCVAVRGPLDAAGVEEVNLALTSQVSSRRKPAILDLTGVGFIASLGIGLLISIAKSQRSRGLGLAVVVAPSPVREVLEMTHLDPMVPVVATSEEALRRLGLT